MLPDGSVEKRSTAPGPMPDAAASCREMSTSGGAGSALRAWSSVAAVASVIAKQTIVTTAVRGIVRMIVTQLDPGASPVARLEIVDGNRRNQVRRREPEYDAIEEQLSLEAPADRGRLAESMLLAFKCEECDGQALHAHGVCHHP